MGSAVVAQPNTQQSPPPPAGFQTQIPEQGEDTKILRNLEYVPNGHERQKLNLYLPMNNSDKPLPLIVWVHGGAWLGGSKENPPVRRFVPLGFAVASVNYRLSQHAIFPAQIEDCKAAIRFLRAHAKQYNIDPTRIGTWGASAGGHLVALLGTTGDDKSFDTGPNLDQSSAVQAVCDFFGPTDFTKMSAFSSTMNHDADDAPEAKLVGGPVQEKKEVCRQANPITYITRKDPPFLIVHGDKDPLVPHNQSQILFDAPKAADVNATLYIVKDGGHGFRDPEVDRLVTEFFLKHLKSAKNSKNPRS